MVRCKLFTLVLPLFCSVFADEEDPNKAFLVENAQKSGVNTLASGVQYKILESHVEGAKGPPQADIMVKCEFEAALVNGTVFDSSYKRGKPQEFLPKNAVPGWSEALQLMHVGDRWEVVIPAELAYGERGLKKGQLVPPNSTLIVTLQLLEIADKQTWEAWLNTVVFNISIFGVTRGMIAPFFVAIVIRSVIGFFSGPATYARVRHLVTKKEPECYKALARINKGEDFSTVASEVSTCRSGKSGGDLGKFGRDIMAPEFDKVVFDTKKTEIGKVYGPLKTEFGYHLLIVDERKISEEDELEAYKEAQKAEEKRKKQ